MNLAQASPLTSTTETNESLYRMQTDELLRWRAKLKPDTIKEASLDEKRGTTPKNETLIQIIFSIRFYGAAQIHAGIGSGQFIHNDGSFFTRSSLAPTQEPPATQPTPQIPSTEYPWTRFPIAPKILAQPSQFQQL